MTIRPMAESDPDSEQGEVVLMSDIATVEETLPEAEEISPTEQEAVAEEQFPEASEAPAPTTKTKPRKSRAKSASSGSKEKNVTKTKARPKKAAAKKTTAKKTTAKKTTAKKTKDEGIGRAAGSAKGGRKPPPEDARERGALEADVRGVTDDYEAGKIKIDGPLTPYRIAKMIEERDGLDRRPSSGAVSNVLKRWNDYGYALTQENPYAFKRLSAAGQKQGLAALKEKYTEKKKAERAAARAKAK